MKRAPWISWCLSLAGLVACLLATGCHSLVPFTHEIRDQSRLKAQDLKNLQFYLSNRVVLRREITSGGREITGSHKLLVISGKTIEEVVIEAGTPGIAVGAGDGTLAISFEPGSSLVFAASRDPGASSSSTASFATPPDPFPGNGGGYEPEAAPVVRPGLFEGAYRLAVDPSGMIRYQGVSFTPVDDSTRAHLLIRAESLDKVVERRKVLPGMKLPGQ